MTRPVKKLPYEDGYTAPLVVVKRNTPEQTAALVLHLTQLLENIGPDAYSHPFPVCK